MKRIAYASLAALSGVVLLVSYRASISSALSSSPGTATASSPQTTSSASGNVDPGVSAESATTSCSGLVDGTYQGQSVSTRYGDVQVQIVVENGTITAADAITYPSENSRDQQINSDAIPKLTSETLSAQSAQIDMISGATSTSRGYLESLQSALDQAQCG